MARGKCFLLDFDMNVQQNKEKKNRKKPDSNWIPITAQKDRERRVSRYSRKRLRDTDNKTEAASSSVTVLSSSASDHDSESDHNRRGISISDTTTDSEVSDSTRYRKRHPDDSQEAQHFRKLLTEESVKLLENEYPPMTTQDRVQYWNLSSELIQIEEEFDLEIDPEQNTVTKPLRSERVSTNCCGQSIR